MPDNSAARETRALIRGHARKRRWQRVTTALASLVVFCTTYALILPAITTTQKLCCGYESAHTDECYQIIKTCPYGAQEDSVGDAVCVCGLEGVPAASSAPTAAPVCGIVAHAHNADCTVTSRTLICALAEHAHSEACAVTSRALTCEVPAHAHTDACRDEGGALVCALEEHAHTDGCYTASVSYTCGMEAHAHSDGCYSAATTYSCGMTAHAHADECFPAAPAESPAPAAPAVTDAPAAHVHTDECFHTHEEACFESTLICDKPLHEHSLACYSDPTADVETASAWEATLSGVTLTGAWGSDTVSVALTQLGYMESAANYTVAADGLTKNGYSRYGQWYGLPYGDWCAMFASFCLNYAAVPAEALPPRSACTDWAQTLDELGLYFPASGAADAYSPAPGDLVFFGDNADGTYHNSNHVGVVKALETRYAADGVTVDAVILHTVEGNVNNMVAECSYILPDARILGYCGLDAALSRYCLLYPEEAARRGLVTDEAGDSALAPLEGTHTQTITADGFSASVIYDQSANIPANADLRMAVIPAASEAYSLACAEAGARFDWLIDLGFFVGDKEVEPADSVIVSVTPPRAVAPDSYVRITHFASSGLEVTDAFIGAAVMAASDGAGDAPADAGNALTFELSSFSLIGGKEYHPATVWTNSVATGEKYHIYSVSGDTVYFLAWEDVDGVKTLETFAVPISSLPAADGSASGVTLTTVSSINYFDETLTGTVDGEEKTLNYANICWYTKAKDGRMAFAVNSDGTLSVKNESGTLELASNIFGMNVSNAAGGGVTLSNGARDKFLAFDAASGSFSVNSSAEGSALNIAKCGVDVVPQPEYTTHTATVTTYNAATFADKDYLIYRQGNEDGVAYLYFLATRSSAADSTAGEVFTLRVPLSQLESTGGFESAGSAVTMTLTDGMLSGVVRRDASGAEGNGEDVSVTREQLLWAVTQTGELTAGGNNKYTLSATRAGYSASFLSVDIASDGGYTLSLASEAYSFELSKKNTNLTNVFLGDGSTDSDGNRIGLRLKINGDDNYSDGVGVGVKNDNFIFAADGLAHSADTHPAAVKTGNITPARKGFFNVCEGSREVSVDGKSSMFVPVLSPLGGVKYELTNDATGAKSYILSNGYDMRVDMRDTNGDTIPAGTYTMRQIEVPNGYILLEYTWRVIVTSKSDSELIQMYKLDANGQPEANQSKIVKNVRAGDIALDKTASVVDYEDRTYCVDLTALSNITTYDLNAFNVVFVVDQSNSMLFPSALLETGASFTVSSEVESVDAESGEKTFGGFYADVSGLAALDKSQLYYIVTEPKSSSTVYAVWWNGGAWMYQDASYYAKAYYGASSDELKTRDVVEFPATSTYVGDTHGGCLTMDLSGTGMATDVRAEMSAASSAGATGTVTYAVYTAKDGYNRLHYLRQALSDILNTLYELNPDIQVTLDLFTSQVNTCVTAVLGKDDGLNTLLAQVDGITTVGGTRQDIALEHVHAQQHDRQNLKTEYDRDVVVLITDGAPVLGGTFDYEKGEATDVAAVDGTVYQRINYWAEQIKGDESGIGDSATLCTIGLAMGDVDSGKKALRHIATFGPSVNDNIPDTQTFGDFWLQAEDSSAVVNLMTQAIVQYLLQVDSLPASIKPASVTDVVSDSFYPIDPATNSPLASSPTYLALNGAVLSAAPDSGSYGTLTRDEDTGQWHVTWTDCSLTPVTSGEGETQTVTGWHGRIYLKAKEDFIGGNSINTNVSAKLTTYSGTALPYPLPNVNVRLLPMNENTSRVTVYKGDDINAAADAPLDSLAAFRDALRFEKLVSGTGGVLNKFGADSASGLYADSFSPAYALAASLTADEWAALQAGQTLSKPYTYNSADGAVGAFEIAMQKSGDGADYSTHAAQHALGADTPAETYTLLVKYSAYPQADTPSATARPKNAHNGAAGAGVVVGGADAGAAPEAGCGTVTSSNVHSVYVISGEIIVDKLITAALKSDADQSFAFTLSRLADDGVTWEIVATKSVTVPAGSTQAEALKFSDLPRGTYSVSEAEDDSHMYVLSAVDVLSDTNCESAPSAGAALPAGERLTFALGNAPSGQDVIAKVAPADRYTAYTLSPDGVLGHARFTNDRAVYYAALTVNKAWAGGAPTDGDACVYVVLCDAQTGAAIKTASGLSRALELNAANNWSASFEIALDAYGDKLSNHSYAIREVSRSSASTVDQWHEASVENSSAARSIWYETLVEGNALAKVGSAHYTVRYSDSVYDDASGGQGITLTNTPAVVLPRTGGVGNLPCILGGLAMMALAVLRGCGMRRRRERRES